jgi:hypothetical protein
VTTLTSDVGRVRPWGTVAGNHHRGTGPARTVELLKGVNCAYRLTALALPRDLRGRGRPSPLRAVGGYRTSPSGRTSALRPLHHRSPLPAARLDDDDRSDPSPQALADSAYNLMRGLSPRYQWRRRLFVLVVGDRVQPAPAVAYWPSWPREGSLASRAGVPRAAVRATRGTIGTVRGSSNAAPSGTR